MRSEAKSVRELSKPAVEYYNAIRSSVRREIVKILSEEENIGVLELRRRLDISVGTLYHHLDILRPYLARTPNRKYALNKKGEVLVSLIASTDDTVKSFEERKSRSYGSITSILTLRPISEGVGNGVRSALAVAPIVPTFYVIFAIVLKIRPQLLFLAESRTQGFETALQAGVNLGLITFFYLIAGFIISRRIDQETRTALAILASSIPTVLYFSFLLVASPAVLTNQNMLLISRTLFVVTHLWQLLSYAAAVSFTKGIGIEKTIAASIALSYLSLLARDFLTQVTTVPL